VIDGDEASMTVREHYPSGPDAALVPAGTEIADFKQLMLEQLERMVEDRISRVVDISGGSRDLESTWKRVCVLKRRQAEVKRQRAAENRWPTSEPPPVVT